MILLINEECETIKPKNVENRKKNGLLQLKEVQKYIDKAIQIQHRESEILSNEVLQIANTKIRKGISFCKRGVSESKELNLEKYK